MEVTITLKICTQKYAYEADQELGGRELSPFACPGVGNSPPGKKNCKSPEVCPGGMVTGQIKKE